ncbi:TRAP transporter substrate-binding protein [Phaeovulum sp.]|uniref:TRAP transporter substrate-binding protein n=2 Tax=Phaeovulum sp. TaxID=2934796 RepID=UPI0027322983|nr:TRAP transporter substrate-binding protein [Phaeovulum sp.]MDP1670270.1 TRAP transporter substrate-binding protein [Phaeovulum sp.]MDZ4118034.1 TRAP transporter substrate-binding protein [Phaeovulum sp.]
MLARLIAAVAVTLGMFSPARAQEVTLRLHEFLPLNSVVSAEIIDPWAGRIEAASGGRIKIEIFPSMQLGGKPADLVDQLVDGVVDIVWTLPGYTPGRFPRTEVFELPFLVADAESASRAYWEIAQSDMIATDFKDMQILGTWVHGPGVVHSSRPVLRLEDMAGLKLRAPSRITAQLLEGLGAVALGMAVPAVPEALSRGVIDGALMPWEITSSIRVPELVHNHTEFPGRAIYVATFILAMNKERYAGLPDDLRAIIDAESGADFSARAGRTLALADVPMRIDALAMGNAVTVLDVAEAARWQAAAGPVVAGWNASMTAAGIDGADLLERAQAALVAQGG